MIYRPGKLPPMILFGSTLKATEKQVSSLNFFLVQNQVGMAFINNHIVQIQVGSILLSNYIAYCAKSSGTVYLN